MCPDEECGGETGIAELTDEVSREASVDFLALELCGMGGIEIAYQWRPGGDRFAADVLLAIPTAGPPLDWDRAFGRIRTPGHAAPADRPPLDPATMTAADFGGLVIEEGQRGRVEAQRRGRDVTHEAAAAYDLARAAGVKESVDALARALHATDSKGAFLALRDQGAADGAINYSEGGPYVDLYDLCRRTEGATSLGAEVRAAAGDCMRAVDAFVIDSFGMSGYEGFEPGRHGVYIVLPAAGAEWREFGWYTMQPATGGHYGRWNFVGDGAASGNGVVENWYELLDSWLDPGNANSYQP
jgi:clostripain